MIGFITLQQSAPSSQMTWVAAVLDRMWAVLDRMWALLLYVCVHVCVCIVHVYILLHACHFFI